MSTKKTPEILLDVYKKRMEGHTIRELSCQYDVSIQTISRWLKDYQTELFEADKATLLDKKRQEEDKLDFLSKVLVSTLLNDCEDITDPETGKMYRDGVRTRLGVIDRLLKVSQQKVDLLGLKDVQAAIVSEADELEALASDMTQEQMLIFLSESARKQNGI